MYSTVTYLTNLEKETVNLTMHWPHSCAMSFVLSPTQLVLSKETHSPPPPPPPPHMLNCLPLLFECLNNIPYSYLSNELREGDCQFNDALPPFLCNEFCVVTDLFHSR